MTNPTDNTPLHFHDLIPHILRANVYDVAIKTPLDKLLQYSQKYHNCVYLKREDLQPVFSFKCRGSYNKMAKLRDNIPDIRGVICASAGNHAQGVALAAARLGIKANIIMPVITPKIKIDAVRRLGGDWVNIELQGHNFDEAAAYARQVEQQDGLIFIHPFDDLEVIAGQGTVGKEILDDLAHIDAVFIPVGGGGLLAGVGAYIKYLKPNIRIIGVEHVESASMSLSLEKAENTTLSHIGVFADGVAVKRVGDLTFALAQQVIDEMITVTTDEICAAINQIFDETRVVCEPSGAISLAGIQRYIDQSGAQNQTLVGIISGANMNFDRLRHVTERTAIGAKSECLLGVTLPEVAGSFRRLCELISTRAITEFNYRHNNTDTAHVFIGIAIQHGQKEINEIIATLEQNDYPVVDFSHDDLAKLHLRYLVGGKLNQTESIFRIEFPEHPGALLNFLTHIGSRNISLFHYRNHGSDYGRVLVGFNQTNNQEQDVFQCLESIGYYYVDESENPAYHLFL